MYIIWYRHHALDTHTPNCHPAAIYRFPNFQFKFSLLFDHFSGYCFHFDLFHSGRMAKFLPRQSEEYIQKGLTNTKKLQAKTKRELHSAGLTLICEKDLKIR